MLCRLGYAAVYHLQGHSYFKNSASTSATKYGFITNPNSKAIFTTWNNDFRFDREGFEIIPYPVSAYPLALASKKLFIFPQIDEGMKEFFNKKH